MSRWLIRLEARLDDLREFEHWFPNGPAFVFSEGENYFLTGSALESHTDAGCAMAASEQFIEELYAVVSLLCRTVKHPKAAAILREDDKGVRQEHVLLAVEFVIDLRGWSKGNGGPTQAQQMLEGSRKDPRLGTALLLWADERRTWPRLYRILEELEFYLGKRVDQEGLCSSTVRERFRRSANTAEVAGKDARHASGKHLPPTQPMSLREATSLVSGLLQSIFRAAAP